MHRGLTPSKAIRSPGAFTALSTSCRVTGATWCSTRRSALESGDLGSRLSLSVFLCVSLSKSLSLSEPDSSLL